MKFGYVTIVGRPNVGKSTLLNRILGQKLSITAPRPQTTRHRILGIHTTNKAQIAFVDTPGMHQGGKRALNRVLNRQALASLEDVDVCVHVIEANKWTDEDNHLSAEIRKRGLPTVLVVNKIDRVKEKAKLLPFLQEVSAKGDYVQVVPVSALKQDGLEPLEATLVSMLPDGDRGFSEDQISDRSSQFFASEIVREKLIRRLGQELPYAATVMIEKFRVEGKHLHIDALIYVETSGQKAIVIGKAGQGLKGIGSAARHDLETFFERPVMLNLWVKEKSNWSDDEAQLKALGYND